MLTAPILPVRRPASRSERAEFPPGDGRRGRGTDDPICQSSVRMIDKGTRRSRTVRGHAPHPPGNRLRQCTRSVADLASLIDTFSRRGVALISAAESLDTSSAGGRLVVNVLGAVAQWEREATAERTSAALQVLKAQGRATGGVAPYGFQFIDGRREWHQGEQETLASSIEHRRAGLSWAKVADKLNATGHRTRTGGQWTRQGAHQVHQARERSHGAAA